MQLVGGEPTQARVEDSPGMEPFCLCESSSEMAESHKREQKIKNKKGRDELGRAEATLGPPLSADNRIATPQPRLRFDRWIDLSSSLD